jgi:hypothetical protein
MGSRTNYEIAAWQAKAGIKEAVGERRECLEALSNAAFELIKIIPLEMSGIRDGNGYWYGGAPVDEAVADLMKLCRRHLEGEVLRPLR